jgi:hypothetical protein
MQRLEFNSRITPPGTPRPDLAESSNISSFDRRTMSSIQTRHIPPTTTSFPKPPRTSNPPVSRAAAEDARTFVREKDAQPSKYMHYFNQLTEKLDVLGPTSSEHQVKQDPSGTLKSKIYFILLN